MRFMTLLLVIFLIAGMAARADSLDQRMHADRSCDAGLKALDAISAAQKKNTGSIADVIDLANRGLRSVAKCKNADGVTYTRGMLTSQLALAQTFTDPQVAKKTLRSALTDLDRCSTQPDKFGRPLQIKCRTEAMHDRAVLAHLPRPTHPERR